MKKKIVIGVLIILFAVAVFFIANKYHNSKVAKEDLNTINKITEIVNKKNDLNKLYVKDNNQEIEDEINECDKLIDELHSINGSGSIRNEYLVNIMNNSVEAVRNHKTALQCSKNLDLKSYAEYNKKESDNIEQIKLEIQRFKISNGIE